MEPDGHVASSGAGYSSSTAHPYADAYDNMSAQTMVGETIEAVHDSTSRTHISSLTSGSPNRATNSRPGTRVSVSPERRQPRAKVPRMTLGQSPMAALYTYLNQRSLRFSVNDKNYFIWDNGGKCHERLFTALFVHPGTGEAFPAGRFGDEFHVDETESRSSPTIWYPTKKKAMHGAAARAYDCLIYREKGESFDPIGLEDYRVQDIPLQSGIPDSMEMTINEEQEKIRNH